MISVAPLNGAIMAPQTPNIVACGKVLYSHARLKVSGRHNILGPKGSCRAKYATMRKAWQFLHAQNPKEDICTEPSTYGLQVHDPPTSMCQRFPNLTSWWLESLKVGRSKAATHYTWEA